MKYGMDSFECFKLIHDVFIRGKIDNLNLTKLLIDSFQNYLLSCPLEVDSRVSFSIFFWFIINQNNHFKAS